MPRVAAARDGKSDATESFHNVHLVVRSASTVSMMESKRSTEREKCLLVGSVHDTNSWLALSRIYKSESNGWNHWSKNKILVFDLKTVHR